MSDENGMVTISYKDYKRKIRTTETMEGNFEDLYARFQQPFMLTSVLLDERNIPQPAFGTLLPCGKGEGTGMRVAIARHDEVRQQKTYTGPHTGRNGESKLFVKKSERKLRKRYLTRT